MPILKLQRQKDNVLMNTATFPSTPLSKRYSIKLCGLITCNNQSFNISWQEEFAQLTTSGYPFTRRNNHQNTLMPLNNTHDSHCTAFLDVPGVKRKQSNHLKEQAMAQTLL